MHSGVSFAYDDMVHGEGTGLGERGRVRPSGLTWIFWTAASRVLSSWRCSRSRFALETRSACDDDDDDGERSVAPKLITGRLL